MKVIKKDGRIQEFDIDKIKITLGYVSDEVKQPLTFSDIDMVARKVERAVLESNDNTIHSSDIQKIVLKELKEAGFNYIAKRYDEYKKDFN